MTILSREPDKNWRLTDAEVQLLKAETLPKPARRLLFREPDTVAATTSAYRKLAAQWRAKAEFHQAYNAAIRAARETEELEGESMTIEHLRKQLHEARELARAAIEGEQSKQRALERVIAKPATAIHAEGTGR